MIDLHLHSTASDGTLDPGPLVARAHGLGVRTLSLTDHDTMRGVAAAVDTAATLGVTCLPGVEISAVLDGRDVHVLAYFLHPSPPAMTQFLQNQQMDRVHRARRIAVLLRSAGVPIDIEALIDAARRSGQSVARPLLARALVDAGHVRSIREAFERWIGDRGPAFVGRQGQTPREVARLVSRAGGITALAHPGLLSPDRLARVLADGELTALEAFHPSHSASDRRRFRHVASHHGLAVSGGSDYHGDDHPRAASFGRLGLSGELFVPLLQRLQDAHDAAHTGPCTAPVDSSGPDSA